MNRIRKMQQRTNVFTMLVLVAGLYIALRHTPLVRHVADDTFGRAGKTVQWLMAGPPLLGWIDLDRSASDMLTLSLQFEPAGCAPTLWDDVRRQVVDRAVGPVMITLEPLVSTGESIRPASLVSRRNLSATDLTRGVEALALRPPDVRSFALMICSDRTQTGSCLGKLPTAAAFSSGHDELFYFQYLIHAASASAGARRIGVVDLPKQAKEKFAALDAFFAAASPPDTTGADHGAHLRSLAAVAKVATSPPFVADGRIIVSLPVGNPVLCGAR